MDCTSIADLDSLNREALIAIYLAQQQQLASLMTGHAQEERMETELELQRTALSEQSAELHSRSERIEHLKLMVVKRRHVIFGAKSEKILVQLGQLELQLEEEESALAEVAAELERIAPTPEPKPRTERKPLPEHLPREVMTYAPNADCCSECGGELRQCRMSVTPAAIQIRVPVGSEIICEDSSARSKPDLCPQCLQRLYESHPATRYGSLQSLKQSAQLVL